MCLRKLIFRKYTIFQPWDQIKRERRGVSVSLWFSAAFSILIAGLLFIVRQELVGMARRGFLAVPSFLFADWAMFKLLWGCCGRRPPLEWNLCDDVKKFQEDVKRTRSMLNALESSSMSKGSLSDGTAKASSAVVDVLAGATTSLRLFARRGSFSGADRPHSPVPGFLDQWRLPSVSLRLPCHWGTRCL